MVYRDTLRQNNYWEFESVQECRDTLAEWLRRRPAKPMGSPRVGSNPTGVDVESHAAHARHVNSTVVASRARHTSLPNALAHRQDKTSSAIV